MQEDNSNWVIAEVEKNGMKCLYTIRKALPAKKLDLSTLVTIEWNYQEADENGFPAGKEREDIYWLDEQLDAMDNEEIATVKVLMITGMGLREWSFYTDSFDSWIDCFNQVMSGKQRVPINISYSEDPQWEYWYKYAKHVAA